MTEGVSFERYPKTMRLAASVTISTSLLAGWPLYSESIISLSMALAIHLFLLVLVIQAREPSVGPRERQLAWTLAGACPFGFIVGGWARSVVRLVLAGGRLGVMALPFSVIEAFLGVVAAVLAVYLWRVRLLRSMAAGLCAGLCGLGCVALLMAGLGVLSGLHGVRAPLPVGEGVFSWLIFGVVAGLVLPVLGRLAVLVDRLSFGAGIGRQAVGSAGPSD